MTRSRTSNHGRSRGMEEISSGGQQPSLCVAYLILTGTSGWALKQISTSTAYAFGTFSFLLGHSLIGFLHSTHPDPPEILTRIYRKTALLAELAPLALMNAEFYLMNGFSNNHAYGHLASAFLPIITELVMEEHTASILDIAILGNLGSLLYLQVTKETGVWTGGLIALTALNHFLFKQISTKFDVPKIEIVTIGLSFFNVFALNCLLGKG